MFAAHAAHAALLRPLLSCLLGLAALMRPALAQTSDIDIYGGANPNSDRANVLLSTPLATITARSKGMRNTPEVTPHRLAPASASAEPAAT